VKQATTDSLQTSPWPLVVVLGPTGSGKSRLAITLARELGGEIVNVDSVQVYRGLDIGTAKVSQAERREIPHHLIDIVGPEEELTAGAYSRMARETLARIFEKPSADIAATSRRAISAIPILAGGTGFYLRALLDGLSPAPSRDSELRDRLTALASRRPAALHRYLTYMDAAGAMRIHPNDRQKLIRAIELSMLGRRPASEIQGQPPVKLEGFTSFKIGLAPDRGALYARLNQRTVEMFWNGLLEETRRLLESGLSRESKALQSLGYKQAIKVLSGEMSLEEAVQECQTRTRQYAKRQLTWFRREPDVHWLSGFGDDPETAEKALQQTKQFITNL
jgi:tRNA dimethylallyltransferase